jgi:formylglycine-generating enzyme required for sulfatase activity
MKIAKRLFWGAGLLALLVPAGCGNLVSSLPAEAEPERGSNAADWRSPFTVTLHINADGSARAAGLTESTIQGVSNYVQLILAQDGNIAAFADNQIPADGDVSLSVTVTPGKYDILLLAGHQSGDNEAVPPTLLATGLTNQKITAGENDVTIEMNPLVVDTRFTKEVKAFMAAAEGTRLTPGDWNLEWTINQGASKTKGFTGLLDAQKNSDINTLFKNKSVIKAESKRWETQDIVLNEDGVTLALRGLAAGATGSYNFNLEYAPFSVNESAGWNGFSAMNQKGGVPVWIIRNGINDLAQDGETDLSAPADWGDTTNGNGAVRFTVSLPPARPEITPPEMAPVAGAAFQMGSNFLPEPYFKENPIHQVTVNNFFMGKHEVTQKEWYAVMGETVDDQLALRNYQYTSSTGVLYGKEDDHPIYYVSWYEAVDYCNRLSTAGGLNPAYTINKDTDPWTVTCDFTAPGYRLPTEAEWEYAARGGNTGESYTYSGSDILDEVAWYSGTSGTNTHPVKGKDHNGLGLYDMSGNVNEWCWDWSQQDYYTAAPAVNPTGPVDNSVSGNFRATRGGDFIDAAANNRTTKRGGIAPHARFKSLGFRVVRTTK